MPYASTKELPQAVKDKIKSPKRRRQWMHVFNSAYDRLGDESRAFASAWAATERSGGVRDTKKRKRLQKSHWSEAPKAPEANWWLGNKPNRAADTTKALNKAKISKESADYKNQTIDSEHCSVCTMFREPDSCTLVKGIIRPGGWCKYFKRSAADKAALLEKSAMTDFNLFLPLAKVEKNNDGTCTVSGYASTPSLDLDGEIISIEAVKKALPGYWEWRNIREMHQASAVGVAKEANIDADGLFLSARIIDPGAVQKCLEGVYKGYSIGGKKLAKKGNTITEIDLVEISIVDRPANPDCRFTVAKRAKDSQEAYLLKASKPSRAKDKELAKALRSMAKVAETLAKDGPPAARDGFSLPAKPETEKQGKPGDILPHPAKCAAHGVENCEKCMEKEVSPKDTRDNENEARKTAGDNTEKREVSTKEREQLASEGHALPHGGFPIANESDLRNAIQAFGRAKNKSKTKKHIIRNARRLGRTDLLPEKWTKAKDNKATKRVKSMVANELRLGASAQPSFLSLRKTKRAEDGLEVRGGGSLESSFAVLGSGNGGAPKKQFDEPFDKGMSTAGSLAYCFDSLRSAQRSLMMEAKREGGDRKDAKLAKELGQIARQLASIIGQKATHEGQEALDLSDGDDMGLNSFLGEEDLAMTTQATGLDQAILDIVKRSVQPTRAQRFGMAQSNLRKARKARKAARGFIEDAHKMHKAAYLSKAAKKPKDNDADDFDHAGAMEKLNKAYNELQKLGTFVKAAENQLEKLGRSGQRGQEAGDSEAGFYEVPPGVKDLTPDALSGAKPGTSGSAGVAPKYPGSEGTDPSSVYPGKAAKFAKNGVIPVEVAELLAENARLEAERNQLSTIRVNNGNSRRPYSFDMTKVMGNGNGNGGSNATGDPLMKAIRESGVDVNALTSPDREDPSRVSAVANVVGTYLLEGSAGKSILDPGFRGGAGGRQ